LRKTREKKRTIDIELGTKGGDDGDGSVEMGVDDVGVAVRRCLVA